MMTQATKGFCKLCNRSFTKRGIARHIESCRRNNSLKPKGKKATTAKVFHILAGEPYGQDYWMNLQVPETATLDDLDSFLRKTWLECCGHLSAFTIGNQRYTSHAHMDENDDDEGPFTSLSALFGDSLLDSDSEIEEPTEEDIQKLLADPEVPEAVKQLLAMSEEDIPQDPEKAISLLQQALLEGLQKASKSNTTKEGDSEKQFHIEVPLALPDPAEMLRQFLKPKTHEEAEDLEDFLDEGTSLGMMPFPSLYDEENCMHYQLKEVLKKGMSVPYEYDFGSTTSLNLRVVSEYNTKVSEQDEPVQILAKNEPPLLTCDVCEKEAALICPFCAWTDEGWLCKSCARKHKCEEGGITMDEDEMLPVVNSPRTGICGYDGESFPDDDF